MSEAGGRRDLRICARCGREYDALHGQGHPCDPRDVAQLAADERLAAQQEADGELRPWWSA